jgi:hypothetical protein
MPFLKDGSIRLVRVQESSLLETEHKFETEINQQPIWN